MYRLVGVLCVVALSASAGDALRGFPASADPAALGRRLVDRFLQRAPEKQQPKGYDGKQSGEYVPYAVCSLWANAIDFAKTTGDDARLKKLTDLWKPFNAEKRTLWSAPYHVDFTIFGVVPLAVYLADGDRQALADGLRYADIQWERPGPDDVSKLPKFVQGPEHNLPYAKQLEFWNAGYTPQTRLWIDDMYMITLLQTQAFRATGEADYIRRTAREQLLYLDRLQLKDGPCAGLFHHAPDVPFVWGRGDGWMAAAMPITLKHLSSRDPLFPGVLAGYRRMMAALLRHQRADGLWGQLIDDPASWSGTSGSAMFTFAFISGVRHGWLDAEAYGPAARRAWLALTERLDADCDLRDVCIGTGKKNDHQYYLDRSRLVGDAHGQAPMLWCVNALLENVDDVRARFAEPPPDCRLQAWYHWTTTAISDKCIVADLAAMGELGVGTAHVFMPGQQELPPHTKPLDPEWWKRWETTLREAKKNGMKIGFHNCPGWSSSGGRWIRPEDSMKVLVAAVTDAENCTRKVKLAEPRASHDFYRDVAVYAFPIDRPAVPMKVTGDFEGDFEKFRKGEGELKLPTDRKDPGHCAITFEYAEPISPTSLVTTWNESQFHLDVEVSASSDGRSWKRIGGCPYRLYNTQLTPKVLPLEKTAPSRFFRISVSTVQPPVWVGFVRRKLAKAEFSSLPLVDDLDNKNGAAVAHGYIHPANPAAMGLAKEGVTDVSGYVKDGIVDLPAAAARMPALARLGAGRCLRLLRVGYTTTGKCCAPAPGNVRGLECDKLSKRGLDAHWPNMPHKMINAPGGKGTVAVSIVDSWEVGGQNWTDDFPAEFKRLRGYDIVPWLPAMAGYTVGTAGETARFLYDVQRTVTDLLCENYFDYFAEKCHAEGVRSATESYGGPFDNLRAFRAADVPTGEFWLGSSPNGTPRVAASAGHLYGRAQIGAEAFTTEAKEGRWQITPHEFRVNGDRGWLAGISQLVYHSYLQQPFMNVKPGFSLDRHGTQFNRHTTWWPEGKWWAAYVHRGQYLLQSGESKADVLVFSGDSSPNAFHYPAELVAAGYDFDYFGPRDLELLEAKDGGAAMPGRLPYSVVWLGTDRFLSCNALRRIKKLLDGGVRIAGRRPQGTPTLMDDEKKWARMVEYIWSGRYSNLKQADSALGALKAFGVRAPAESGGCLQARRRVIGGRDFYFVVNPLSEAYDGPVSFAAKGRPELWDAKTGRISPLAWYADEAGRVKTLLSIPANGSVFVSFRDPIAGESPKTVWDGPVTEYAEVAIVSARYEARDDAKLGMDVTERLKSMIAEGSREFHVGNNVLKVRDPASNHYKVLRVDWTADGEAHHSDFAEHGNASFRVKRKMKMPAPDVIADISKGWTVTSFRGANAPSAPLAMDVLKSWSASSDPKLKYFAGRAVYERKLDRGEIGKSAKGGVTLDLGDVREIASVYVDGEFLECLWEAPYRVKLPKRFVEQAAVRRLELKLEVVNTWPNRLIGDAKARKAGAAEPSSGFGVPDWVREDRPDSGTGIYTWMNWMKGWTADDEPRPAGLLGPVRLIAE